MPVLHIHAGVPKTGTTLVQNWLVAKRLVLARLGVFAFDDEFSGHRLAVAAIADPVRLAEPDIGPILQNADLDRLRESLREAVKTGSFRRIAISSEYFTIADPALAKREFDGLGLASCRIIFGVRRQDRFIESSYNQSVKAMRRSDPLGPATYDPTIDWYRVLSNWGEAFGRENIDLVIYDDVVRANDSILSAVLRKIDPALENVVEVEKVPVTNESLSAEAVELIRLANATLSIDTADFVRLVGAGRIGGTSFRMEPAKAKALLDIYRDANRRIKEEFLGGEGDLFDESDLDGPVEGADLTGRLSPETVVQLALLIYERQQREAVDVKGAIEALQGRLAAAESRLSGEEQRMVGLEQRVAGIEARLAAPGDRPAAAEVRTPPAWWRRR